MTYNKTWKTQASACIRSRHGRAFLLTFYTACGLLVLGMGSYLVPIALTGVVHAAIWNAVCQAVMLLCGIWLFGSMRQGTCAWYAAAASGRSPSFIQPLYWLRRGRGFAAFGIRLRVWVRKSFCYALFTAPGILPAILGLYEMRRAEISDFFFYTAEIGGGLCFLTGVVFAMVYCRQYDLVYLLLARSPEKKARELIRQSRDCMQGRCLRALGFRIAHLPFLLAGFGILPLPFILPHYRMRKTCYYAQIQAQALSSNVAKR